jgi:drug/metabolite transporter (DMT)-like permease
VLAIALALGSSLVYGVSDFLGGLKSREVPLLSVLLISQAGALVVLAGAVAALGEGPPEGRFVLYAVLAGVSEAVGVAALYRGLAQGVMSIVAPVAATAPVVPVIAAVALGELPDPVQGVGIALALAGIAIISCDPAGLRGAEGVRPSVLFGLLTALGFGGFLIGMDAASEGGVAWALLVTRLSSVAVFVGVFLVARPSLRVSTREVPLLALIGILVITADALYAIATTEGLLSVVAVLSSLYPAVTIALARVFLGERLERTQQIGALAALGGVVAISVG